MQNNPLHNILFLQLKNGKELDIAVVGNSMEPSFFNGDVVTLRSAGNYEVGDILVFVYKNNELLMHRLLFIKNDRYYCKGDNSFRLEDVSYEQIAGKAIKRNGGELPIFTLTAISLSYLVNRNFKANKYQIEETQKSGIYRFYKQYITKMEDLELMYQKNNTMDYISSDETSLAVFDSESGDTHFFNETGMDILNCLEDPITLKELLKKLCEIYEAYSEDIQEEVEEFLAECISKKVVIVI